MDRLSLVLGAPYVGLRPFDERDALLFFGRKPHVDDLILKLNPWVEEGLDGLRGQDDALGSPRFLAVLGASGTGKSSLIRAGLIPALHRGAAVLPSARRWHVVTIKPGNAPMSRLADGLLQLGSVLGDFGEEQRARMMAAKLESSASGLVDLYMGSMEHHHDEALLVFVDQFEEIFRYRQKDRNEAEAFVKLLLRATSQPQVPIYVVVTMRADFLDQAVSFPLLPEAINRGLYLTPRLDIESLRSVVQSPMRLVSGAIEPALVARLLNDLGGEDDLPVLQHALLRMWTRAIGQGRREISMDDYWDTCGLREDVDEAGRAREANLQASIDNYASQLFDDLSVADRATARDVFVALVEKAGGRYIRREQHLSELLAIVGVENADGCRRVLDAFRARGVGFLVPARKSAADERDVADEKAILEDDDLVDIAHESLFRQWRTFQEWLKQEAADLELLEYHWARTQRHLATGGAWLDEPECQATTKFVEAVMARNCRERWVLRYPRVPKSAITDIREFALQSRDRLRGEETRKRLNTRMLQLLSFGFLISTVVASWSAVKASRTEAATQITNTKLLATTTELEAQKKALQTKQQALEDSSRQLESQEAYANLTAQIAYKQSELANSLTVEAQKRATELEASKVVGKVQDIWAPLMSLGEGQREEQRAPFGLLSLARADVATKKAFMERVFSNADYAAKFNENPIAVLRAAVGVSPAMRQWAIAEVASRVALKDTPPSVVRASTLVDSYLSQSGFDALLTEIRGAEKPTRLKLLKKELVEVLRAAPPTGDLLRTRLVALRDAWSEATKSELTKSELRSTLIGGMEAAVESVKAADASSAIQVLLPAGTGTSPAALDQVLAFRTALEACAKQLREADRTALMASARAGLAAKQTDKDRLPQIVVVALLLKTMPPAPAQAGAVDDVSLLRSGVNATYITQALRILGDALARVGNGLGVPDADGALAGLAIDLMKARDVDQIDALAKGLDAVSGVASEDAIRAVAQQAVVADSGGGRARALSILARRASPSLADDLLASMSTPAPDVSPLRDIRRIDNTPRLPFLARASAARTAQIADGLLAGMKSGPPSASDRSVIAALGDSQLSQDKANALAHALMDRASQAESDDQLAMASMLGSLAGKLPAADAARVLDWLMALLQDAGAVGSPDARTSKDVWALAETALVVAGQIPPNEPASRRRLLEVLIDTPDRSSRPPATFVAFQLQRMGQSLDTLPYDSVSAFVDNDYHATVAKIDRVVDSLAANDSEEVFDEFMAHIERIDKTAGVRPLIVDLAGIRAISRNARSPGNAGRGHRLLSFFAKTSAIELDHPCPPWVKATIAHILNDWVVAQSPGPAVAAMRDSLITGVAGAYSDEQVHAVDAALANAVRMTPSADISSVAPRLTREFGIARSEVVRSVLLKALLEILPSVKPGQAADLARSLHAMAAQSLDPTTIAQIGQMEISLAPQLSDTPETSRILVDFIKYPSTDLRAFVQALRKDPARVPPYGQGVPEFVAAIQKTYHLDGILDTPALKPSIAARQE